MPGIGEGRVDVSVHIDPRGIATGGFVDIHDLPGQTGRADFPYVLFFDSYSRTINIPGIGTGKSKYLRNRIGNSCCDQS